jgi:hypothetical protein
MLQAGFRTEAPCQLDSASTATHFRALSMESLMKRTAGPRIAALLASVAMTFLIVQTLADYGYPTLQWTVAVAPPASGVSR